MTSSLSPDQLEAENLKYTGALFSFNLLSSGNYFIRTRLQQKDTVIICTSAEEVLAALSSEAKRSQDFFDRQKAQRPHAFDLDDLDLDLGDL